MKRSLTYILLPLFLASSALAEKIVLKVDGMTCNSCAESVTESFKAKPQIKDVSVSVKEKQVVLDLKDGESLSDEEILKSISKLGYQVTEVVRG